MLIIVGITENALQRKQIRLPEVGGYRIAFSKVLMLRLVNSLRVAKELILSSGRLV